MQFGILPHDETTINDFSQLTPAEIDEYSAWHDEHFEPVTDEEINDMYRQHESRPTGGRTDLTHNGWTLQRMNGQTLVLVEDTVIGHIFTIHNDDIYNLHWTHSDASSNGWGKPSWIEQSDCIADLVSRYRKTKAKRELVQLAVVKCQLGTNTRLGAAVSQNAQVACELAYRNAIKQII